LIERSRLPYITLTLILANLIASFAVAFDPELVMDLGFNSKSPGFVTAFTGLFLHQNLLHLLGNMVFLAAVGAAVELATGSVRFLIVYFVSGLLGVAAHFILTMSSREPQVLIGASGCISGCAAYYSVRYTGLKVPIAPHKALTVAVVTGIWLALQMVGAFVHIGESAPVSYWAHLGGFLGGLLLSAIFRAPDLGQRKLGHAVLDQMNERGPAAIAMACRQHLEAHPKDQRGWRDLIEAERQQGHRDKEAEAILKLIELLPEMEQVDLLFRLAEIGQTSQLPSVRRTLLADRYQTSAVDLSRVLLGSVIDGPEGDPQIPDAMLALAALEWAHNDATAQEILKRLQEKYPLHPSIDLARHRGWIP